MSIATGCTARAITPFDTAMDSHQYVYCRSLRIPLTTVLLSVAPFSICLVLGQTETIYIPLFSIYYFWRSSRSLISPFIVSLWGLSGAPLVEGCLSLPSGWIGSESASGELRPSLSECSSAVARDKSAQSRNWYFPPDRTQHSLSLQRTIAKLVDGGGFSSSSEWRTDGGS